MNTASRQMHELQLEMKDENMISIDQALGKQCPMKSSRYLKRVIFLVFIFSFSTELTGTVSGAEPIGLNGKTGSFAEHLLDLRQLPQQSVESTSESTAVTLEEIKKAIERRNSSLRDFSLDAKFDLSDASSAGQELRESFSIMLVASGDKQFCHCKRSFPEASGESISSWNGREYRVFEPETKSGRIESFKHPNPSEWMELVFSAAYYLPGLTHPFNPLDYPDHFKVTPEVELVDGNRCVVVSSGDLTVWFDLVHDFAPRRIVYFRRTSESGPDCLCYIVMVSELTMISDQYWFPKQLTRLEFSNQDGLASLSGTLRTIYEIHVESHPVNKTDDSVFTFRFPSGTKINDRRLIRLHDSPNGVNNTK